MSLAKKARLDILIRLEGHVDFAHHVEALVHMFKNRRIEL